VVTERMPSMRSVTLGVWVDVGSRDERPQLAGASHFLEHLLFKGTKTRTARQIAESFDAIGGDLNAFTAKEYTCYYCRVSDEDLPMAVEAMADMLQHSIIAAKDLEAERQVILEEINMRDDDPGDLIHDVFAETLWGDHPLGRPVLGTRETIAGMTRDQVKRFYDRLYIPHHFVIAAAGNLDHEEVCRLIESQMDTGRRVTGTSRKLRVGGDVPTPRPATDVQHRGTEQAHISMGTNGYSRRDPERFAFGVVNSILGGGMSSRLFQEIREKRGMAYSVYSYHTMYTEAGMFSIYAGTTPTNAQEVVRIARGQMEDLASGGLTEEELERAKGHVRGSLVLSLEDTSGRMSRIGRGEISHGEILSVDELIARTEAVTKEDAVATAAEVFSRPTALAVIGPFRKKDFASATSSGDGGGAAEPAAAHGGAGR
jgi:predicted Zn-dependent peptidase